MMRRNRALVILVLLAALAFALLNLPKTGAAKAVNSTLEIHFLNVSQGDAIFLRNRNETMLVDCGPSEAGETVSGYLASLDVYAIDYLVITHTDFDHLGGCAEILQKFYVKKVVMDGQKRDTLNYNRTVALITNETLVIAKKYGNFELGEADLTVLHANTGSPEPNQNSIVLIVYFGNFTLLLDADCDSECENSLLSENIDADVLKVAHHGSRYASSSEFLQKVSPEIAVISVGENSYGHPANETLERLGAAGAEILRTDANGTIILRTNGSGYEISAQN